MTVLPSTSAPSPVRLRGRVVDLDVERGFGFAQELNKIGVPFGPRAFIHRGGLRAAAHGRVELPPLGAVVSYIGTRSDGRLRAADLVVEEES